MMLSPGVGAVVVVVVVVVEGDEDDVCVGAGHPLARTRPQPISNSLSFMEASYTARDG